MRTPRLRTLLLAVALALGAMVLVRSCLPRVSPAAVVPAYAMLLLGHSIASQRLRAVW